MDELQVRGLFSALLSITLVAIIFLLSRFLEINRRGIWTPSTLIALLSQD
jgi:hypothetical protein